MIHFRKDNDLIKLPAQTCAVVSGFDLPVGYMTALKSRESARRTLPPVRVAASSGVSKTFSLPVEDELTEQKFEPDPTTLH
jgi:hypothetical protein